MLSHAQPEDDFASQASQVNLDHGQNSFESLKYEVTQALILQKTGEIFELLSRPDINATFTTGAIKIAEEFVRKLAAAESQPGYGISDEDIESALEEVRRETSYKLQNPTYLLEVASQTAKDAFLTPEETLQKFKDGLTTQLIESGAIDEDVALQILDILNPLLRKAETKKEMVVELTQLAEKIGVAEATKDENVYAVIRKQYPTRLAYDDHYQQEMKLVRETLDELKELLKEAMQDQANPEIFMALMSQSIDLGLTISKVERDNMAAKIYQ